MNLEPRNPGKFLNVGAALESPASRSALRYGCGDSRDTKAPPTFLVSWLPDFFLL